MELRSVKIDAVHTDLVNKLAKDKNTKIFLNNLDTLIFAALLGVYKDKYEKVEKTDLDPVRTTEKWITSSKRDFIYLLAYIKKKKDLSIFKKDSKEDITLHFESYAKGGLDIIKSWLQEYGSYNNPQEGIIKGLVREKLIKEEYNGISSEDVSLSNLKF